MMDQSVLIFQVGLIFYFAKQEVTIFAYSIQVSMVNYNRPSYRDSFLFSIQRVMEALCRAFAGSAQFGGHDAQLGGG